MFQLKATVLHILRRLGLPMKAYVIENGANDLFSRSLAIKERSGRIVAEFGLVAKALTAQLDIAQSVYFAELDWNALMKAAERVKLTFCEISKFPAVSRDLALLVDKNVQFADIERIAQQAEKKLLKRVRLFDVYEGKNLPEGKKNFQLQDDSKTMNDKQTDAIMNKIITQLQKQLNATLR